MKYSTDPPAEPGWYFSRYRVPELPAIVVYVTRADIDLPRLRLRHIDTVREWAGPIPEPEEA